MTIKEVSEKYKISADALRYYERVGMIPSVTRSEGGIRNYTQDDIAWVELVICMRSTGLPVEAIIEYVKLFKKGDSTMQARLELLKEQRERLIEQKEKINVTLNKLNYKISVYEKGVKTGVLEWNKTSCENPENTKNH